MIISLKRGCEVLNLARIFDWIWDLVGGGRPLKDRILPPRLDGLAYAGILPHNIRVFSDKTVAYATRRRIHFTDGSVVGTTTLHIPSGGPVLIAGRFAERLIMVTNTGVFTHCTTHLR